MSPCPSLPMSASPWLLSDCNANSYKVGSDDGTDVQFKRKIMKRISVNVHERTPLEEISLLNS